MQQCWSTGARIGWKSGQGSKSRASESAPGYFLKNLVSDAQASLINRENRFIISGVI